MQDMVRKIKEAKLVTEDQSFHGGLFVVIFEGQDLPACVFGAELDLLRFEQEMLEKGVPEYLIVKHRKLAYDCVAALESLNGEDS